MLTSHIQRVAPTLHGRATRFRFRLVLSLLCRVALDFPDLACRDQTDREAEADVDVEGGGGGGGGKGGGKYLLERDLWK